MRFTRRNRRIAYAVAGMSMIPLAWLQLVPVYIPMAVLFVTGVLFMAETPPD